jgi:hypothetical protein
MINRLREVTLINLVLLLAVGCAAVSATASPAIRPDPSSAGLPMLRSVADHLPAGVFYLDAGTNPASYNIWQVSNTGQEIRLTHNSPNFGISNFTASSAGIVMADGSSGFDGLARLTSSGVVIMKNGDNGDGPDINSAGEIVYAVSTYDAKGGLTGAEVTLRKSFDAPARIIYKQKDSILGTLWGPGGSIAVLSGTHYPGTKGPTPKVLIIDKSGKVTTLRTGMEADLGSILWNEHQGSGLAVWTWHDKAEVIYSSSRRYALPAGWVPAAWNPAGTQLLVRKPGREIGLWSPARPHSVKVIGSLQKSTDIGQFSWLAKPAKL